MGGGVFFTFVSTSDWCTVARWWSENDKSDVGTAEARFDQIGA
jgi:hypothetical protein